MRSKSRARAYHGSNFHRRLLLPLIIPLTLDLHLPQMSLQGMRQARFDTATPAQSRALITIRLFRDIPYAIGGAVQEASITHVFIERLVVLHCVLEQINAINISAILTSDTRDNHGAWIRSTRLRLLLDKQRLMKEAAGNGTEKVLETS